MGKSHSDICHEFFHTPKEKIVRSSSLWYDGQVDEICSYSTVFGVAYRDINVLLMEISHTSQMSSKAKRNIIDACPYPHDNVLYVHLDRSIIRKSKVNQIATVKHYVNELWDTFERFQKARDNTHDHLGSLKHLFKRYCQIEEFVNSDYQTIKSLRYYSFDEKVLANILNLDLSKGPDFNDIGRYIKEDRLTGEGVRQIIEEKLRWHEERQKKLNSTEYKEKKESKAKRAKLHKLTLWRKFRSRSITHETGFTYLRATYSSLPHPRIIIESSKSVQGSLYFNHPDEIWKLLNKIGQIDTLLSYFTTDRSKVTNERQIDQSQKRLLEAYFTALLVKLSNYKDEIAHLIIFRDTPCIKFGCHYFDLSEIKYIYNRISELREEIVKKSKLVTQ